MSLIWIVVIVLLVLTVAGIAYKYNTGSCPINLLRRKKK